MFTEKKIIEIMLETNEELKWKYPTRLQEYKLPSGKRIDAYFENDEEILIFEAKASGESYVLEQILTYIEELKTISDKKIIGKIVGMGSKQFDTQKYGIETDLV